jgi:hypothetical protein
VLDSTGSARSRPRTRRSSCSTCRWRSRRSGRGWSRGRRGCRFYLDLQVDLYESLKNQGRAPEPAQFGGSEPEILGRFLDHLGGEAARALAVLAHCRRFDEALWLHLGREFMGGLPPFAFGELRGSRSSRSWRAGGSACTR